MSKLTLSFSVLAMIGASFAYSFAMSVEASPTATRESLVVFLVRHAEKSQDGRDPSLSAEGQIRAQMLTTTLRDAKLTHVHSTDYRRTMETAVPTAESQKLKVKTYDPRKLAEFADSLLQAGGRHLVVGHSNTTPALVKLLGGDPVSAIEEQAEYDRLYIVTVSNNAEGSSVLIRYGKSPAPDEAP